MSMSENRTENAPRPAFDRRERFRLDPDSPVPLYHQVEQIIQARISEEEMLDSTLPAETELTEIFGVSRSTIRQALDNLVGKGLVKRRRSLGTRVTRPPITEDLTRLSSYTEEMQNRNLSILTRLLGVEKHQPDPYVKGKLGLEPGEETLSIRRLRGTNELFPVVVLHTEIPAAFGIEPDEDFSLSLYRVIEDKYKIPIVWAEEKISAGNATVEEAELLEVAPGSSVLVMERLTYTLNDRPLEYVKGIYRPDRYQFSVRLKR